MVEVRNLEKEIRKLKDEQAKYLEAKRIEEQKALLDQRISIMLAEGMSADDILARLK